MLFLVLILTAIKLAVSGLTLQILVADKAHLSMKGANTRYSHPQPLGWGTRMWWPKIVCHLLVMLRSWVRTELLLAAAATFSFQELLGQRCQRGVWCPASCVLARCQQRRQSQCRLPTASVVTPEESWLTGSVRRLCRGSGCTDFVHSCLLAKLHGVAFLTNLWADQHLNSCSAFCCLTCMVIHKESSPI